jgi:hypothetical protein
MGREGKEALYYTGVLGSKVGRYGLLLQLLLEDLCIGKCADHGCHFLKDLMVRRFEISFGCIYRYRNIHYAVAM